MWTRQWSRSKQAPYWHHSGTNQTSWTDPTQGEPEIEQRGEGAARAEEWVQRFSSTKQAPYWVNSATNEATWTKPATARIRSEEDQGAKKRMKIEEGSSGGVKPFDSKDASATFKALLDAERTANSLPDTSLPRERNDINMSQLVRRLHRENAERKDVPPNEVSEKLSFRVIFTLLDEDVSHITRAIQEDEILKTRLKLQRDHEVIDLPSFWDVWQNPETADLKRTIITAHDPHEAKWRCARQFNYKMATTFMPGYAKAVYQYFGASVVLDPCSGWGDRLLGASASNCVRSYIGFDPNKCLRPGYAELLQKSVGAEVTNLSSTSLQLSNGFKIYSLPFEKGAPELVPDGHCDLVFTSPPFFDYEMYNPSNPKYRDWIKEFYEPLFFQAARCVKPHGFVCIHIGDTSAGEIVPFLKNRVNEICTLQLVHTLGLTGVMSKKIREVWVFRNTRAPLYQTPSDKFRVSMSHAQWISKLTNPPLQPREIYSSDLNMSFVLLDDGALCIGGTKQRLLGRLLGLIPQKEIVYAGPDGGMAQVALAYTTRLWHKKAVLFLNANSDHAMKQPLVKMAKGLGGDIRLGNPGEHVTLKMAEESAQAYVAADPSSRFLSPFGLRKERGDPLFELFRSVLLDALCFVQSPPKRMWLVSGSGFIMDVLHSIWPQTKFMIVQVGKRIWHELLEGKHHELFIADQAFSESVDEKLRPTEYNSVPWYDAKLWQFVLKHGQPGDYIWNVAAVPNDIESVVQDAILHIEQYEKSI